LSTSSAILIVSLVATLDCAPHVDYRCSFGYEHFALSLRALARRPGEEITLTFSSLEVAIIGKHDYFTNTINQPAGVAIPHELTEAQELSFPARSVLLLSILG